MKKTLPLLWLMVALLSGFTAAAQDAVEYAERVPTENFSRQTLQARAADWVEHHFAYGPKTNLKTNAEAGTVSVQGTVKVKPVDNKGQNLERTARFEFTFTATDQGYNYSVGHFQVIADPQQLDQLVPMEAYLAQLAAEKNVDKTKNDKRVRAQANSLASEIAMSFRGYMSQIPTAEDGSVGLPAGSSAGN
ncbi:DUF4468 domain-containing protein [Hymenobacter gummosus]|uniref:DUF4468 domain-containing protein n=1 Tax=Hymenobacter gummosus TaxID=1776032 RepID=A0A431U346_9BACT|nr:DUF4468 domain-containing protein [Hymenobacter gummosus]RTQ49735.1 DUF4468 domain-containing protein [Hymenobacter gummosus]